MRRTATIFGLAGALIALAQPSAAQEVVGGALMGAAIGGYVGGVTSGRVEGTIGGIIAGGTAGAIIGSDVEKRRGYFWWDGYCYHGVNGRNIRVTKRYCY